MSGGLYVLKTTVEVAQKRLPRARESGRHRPRYLPRPRSARGTYVLKTTVEVEQRRLWRARENGRHRLRYLPRPRSVRGINVLKTTVEVEQQWLRLCGMTGWRREVMSPGINIYRVGVCMFRSPDLSGRGGGGDGGILHVYIHS